MTEETEAHPRLAGSSLAPWIAPTALAAIAAALIGFLPEAASRIGWFAELAVPLLLAALALAAVLGVRVAWRALGAADARLRPDLASAVVLLIPVIAIAIVLPGEMRIQTDELLIAGTTLGLGQQHAPVVVAGGFITADGLVPVAAFVDKRGVLAPLVAASAQRLGVPDAGFALNLVWAWLALVAFYALARQWLAPAAALAAALVLAGAPPFLWSVRSLLIEPLNTALVATILVLTVRSWRHDRPDLAVLAAVLGPLAAQARYESVIVGALALGSAGVLLWRRPGRLGWLLCVVPLLYLPFAWQRAVDFSWGIEQLGETEPFALAFLVRNAQHALEFHALPSALNPLAPLLLALALYGVARAIHVARAAPWSMARLVPAACVGAGVLAPIVIVLCFAWGDLRNPVTARLGLGLTAAIALAATVGWSTLRSRVTARTLPDVLLGVVVLVAGVVAVQRDRTLDRLQVAPALIAARDRIGALPPACRPLLVTPYAPYFLAEGISAVSPAYADADWPRLAALAQRHGAGGVFLVQVTDGEGRALAGNSATARIRARLVDELRVDAWNGVRIAAIESAADVPLPACP